MIGGQVRAKVESDKQQKADPKHHQQGAGKHGVTSQFDGR